MSTGFLEKRVRRRIIMFAGSSWYLYNFRRSLARAIEVAGYDVVLVAPPSEFVQRFRDAGFTFETLQMDRGSLNLLSELHVLWRLLQLCRRIRPDLILSWTPKANIYAGIVGRLLRRPVIPNVSGLGFVFARGGALALLVAWLYRFAFLRVPLAFFQNDEDRRMFIEAHLVTSNRARRLPGSGVDLRHFAFRPLHEPRPFVFLYSGRLLADKGLRELVEAANVLRSSGRRFTLRIAGLFDSSNPAAITRSELDGWVLDGAVEYLGALEDVRPALELSHCVVLASYYREGVPRGLLEAAATGRPIITTDAPGCRDAVVSGESGLLCPPKDVTALSRCMASMLDFEMPRLKDMGKAGRGYVERYYSEDIVLNEYLRACEVIESGASVR